MANKKEPQLNDVLRLCMSNTSGNENIENIENIEQSETSTSESREWLKELLAEMSENTVIKRLTQSIKDCYDSQDNPDLQAVLLDDMVDLCEDLDIANDFNKIGGYKILMPLLNSQDTGVKSKCANLIAVLVQNNPACQQSAIDTPNLMHVLTELISNSPDNIVKEKCLYAVSCIVRNYDPGFEIFIKKYNGLHLLMCSIQSQNKKLQIKSSFLLSQIISNVENVSMDIIEDLFKQLIFVLETMELFHQRDEFVSFSLLQLIKMNSLLLDHLIENGFQWIKDRIIHKLKDNAECEEEMKYLLEIYKICLKNKVIDR